MRKPKQIAIIGLGYVGLPLAVEFGKQYPTLGFDVKPARVAALQAGNDETGEVSPEGLAAARHLEFTTDAARLRDADVYIVAVPDADRPASPARSRPADRRLGTGGRGDRARRRGDLREHRLSRRHRGGLPAGGRARLGARLQPRLLRRLLARTHQSRRQGPPDHEDRQGDLRLDARDGGIRRRALPQHHPRRHASRPQHQGGRGLQDHREHPARREHRADQRARHHLRPSRHRHHGGDRGGRDQVEFRQAEAGARRRALHRGRPLLPGAQVAFGRPYPRHHPAGARDQRRHGPPCRRQGSSGR